MLLLVQTGSTQYRQREPQLANVNPSPRLPPVSTVMTQPCNCVQISFISPFYNRLSISSAFPGWSYMKNAYIYIRVPNAPWTVIFTQPYSPAAEHYTLFLSLCVCLNREVTLKDNYWAWRKTKPLQLLLTCYKFKGLQPSEWAFLVFS